MLFLTDYVFSFLCPRLLPAAQLGQRKEKHNLLTGVIMELYQLRTFLVVAEEKSITRAAKRLFTTPPSISAHIKMLEDEWNVSLFRRTAKGMEITEKGELLRRKAEVTLLSAQDLANHATELLGCLMGSLRIGLSSSATFLR